jgi:hypothetical protein
MIKNQQEALRAAGWTVRGVSQKALDHVSGARVVCGPLGWRATRADGQSTGGHSYRADAMAWALGEPPRPRPTPRRTHRERPKPPPAGEWEGPFRRLLKHANGTVDLGPTSSSSKIAQLRSGERRAFRDQADAKKWVAGNGVFPPGYVPAEKRGA